MSFFVIEIVIVGLRTLISPLAQLLGSVSLLLRIVSVRWSFIVSTISHAAGKHLAQDSKLKLIELVDGAIISSALIDSELRLNFQSLSWISSGHASKGFADVM